MKSRTEHTKTSDCAIHPGQGGFCSQLSESALRDLRSYMVSVIYPEDATLFEEQEPLRGVFVLTSGLAKLLLDWSETGQATKEGIRVKMPLAHEEIGEFIGTTRETVSRTLGQFKNRRLVALHGATLMISNRAGLERMGMA